MSRNKKFVLIIVSILIIVVIAVGGYWLKEGIHGKEKNIKIGAILPLTGQAASMGEILKRGLELAIEDVNHKERMNETKLELIVEDGRSDPKASISAFLKLKEQGIKVFTTTMSGVSLALVPIADESQVLLFADAAHPQITGTSQFVFRHSNTADQEGKILADFILGKITIKKLAILWVNDDYGLSLRNALVDNIKADKNADIQIQDLSSEKAEIDFRSHIGKIMNMSPDGVVVIGYGKALGIAIKRLREYKYKGPIWANMGFVLTPDAISVAGNAAESVYHNSFDFDLADPKYNEFQKAYKEKYNSKPPSFVLLEYNTMLIIARAIKEVGYDPGQMATYIRNMGVFQGTGEYMTINAKGDILPKVSVQQYKGSSNP